MDWKIEYNEPQQVVRLELYGRYSADDMLKALSEVTSKPYWHPGASLLSNMASVDVSVIHTPDIEVLIELVKKFRQEYGKARVATVVGTDEQFGLNRQFQTLVDGKVAAKFSVFYDEFSALSWLSKAGNAVC
jgi:hypothetical protein